MDVPTVISAIDSVYGVDTHMYREIKHGRLMTSLFGMPSAHYVRVYASSDNGIPKAQPKFTVFITHSKRAYQDPLAMIEIHNKLFAVSKYEGSTPNEQFTNVLQSFTPSFDQMS